MNEKLQKKNFHFEALLGFGSFGQVYLVKRRTDEKQYVIKQQEITTNNTMMNKMIKAEVECLQILRHPNIISYYGAWQESGWFYMLLEYAAHGTLKELLDSRTEPLSETDSMYLFAQIVLGVRHIHSKNILHRDLKPENIMLTGRMGDIIKICDFGLSREFDVNNQSHAGSYSYMAPEMLMKKFYDFKSDVWSMGVIFYEMLTKELAFSANSLREIVEILSLTEPRQLFLKVEVAREIKIIVYKMLLKDPAKRPTTKLLLLNPSLVTYVAKVYLNLGRIHAVPDEDFSLNIFKPFLKSTAKDGKDS